MKITHLNNQSRSSIGITQGLLSIDVKLSLKHNYLSFGELIQSASPHIKNDMIEADWIIIADQEGENYLSWIDKWNLWSKIIHYDYRDTCSVNAIMLKKAKRCFKRSISFGPHRQMIPHDNIHLIHHCSLNEYYSNTISQRDIDIGCFFNIDDPVHLGIRRNNLIQTLKSLDPSPFIGYSTGQQQQARLAINDTAKNNCFYEFLKLQQRSKIIFTAQPSHCEGDNRTWEAMASGALVFMDQMYHPMPKPFISGQHCIIYNALDIQSIKNAYDQAKWYLKNENKRKEIAERGFDFVKQYHRPVNRAKYLLWQTLGLKYFN